MFESVQVQELSATQENSKATIIPPALPQVSANQLTKQSKDAEEPSGRRHREQASSQNYCAGSPSWGGPAPLASGPREP